MEEIVMKKSIKKIAALLMVATLAIATLAVTAFAADNDNYTKDEAKAYIWSEIWSQETVDDSTKFPESSYKYNMVCKWLDKFYGKDSTCMWNDDYSILHAYKEWYEAQTENLDFNDDRNGGWTIEDVKSGEKYHFELKDGKWNEIDSKGNIVETFAVYKKSDVPQGKITTLETADPDGAYTDAPSSDAEYSESANGLDENGEATGQVNERAAPDDMTDTEKVTSKEVTMTSSSSSSEAAESQSQSEKGNSNTIFIALGSLIVVGVAGGVIVYRKKVGKK